MIEKKGMGTGVINLDQYFRFLQKLIKLIKFYINLLLQKLNMLGGTTVIFSPMTLLQ
jgi:hypothetical protein